MKKIIIHRNYRRTERGFNLLELALALAIAGLLIGGIWILAATVRENMSVYNAQKQILSIVNKIRDTYLSRATIVGDYANLTQTLAQQDVFPAEMKRNPNILAANCAVATPCIFNNPWDSTSAAPVSAASFDGTTVGNAGRFFRLRYANLPVYACLQLATRFSQIVEDVKMTALLINGVSNTVPVSITTATTACNATSNTLDFQFNVRN
jgi:prepilin-type N-terminal cleavage/methylation domain-containing protein